MRPVVVFQTVLFLVLAQVILGAIGYLLPTSVVWLSLPLLLLFIWLIGRVAGIFRQEMALMQKRGASIDPPRLALFLSVVWQLPSLLVLAAFMPTWAMQVWQGALLAVPEALGLFSPTAGATVTRWLGLAAFAEMAFFALIASRPVEKRSHVGAPVVVERPVATGEWVSARKSKRTRTAPTDEGE
jgi:hypothetical protein